MTLKITVAAIFNIPAMGVVMYGGDENDNDGKSDDYDARNVEDEDDDEDSYDNQGNAISEYFEINGVILGKTTRQKIFKMGGKLLD